MLGGGRPLLPENLGQPAPVGEKSPIFSQYSFARSASAVVSSKKVHLQLLTLIGSPLYALPKEPKMNSIH